MYLVKKSNRANRLLKGLYNLEEGGSLLRCVQNLYSATLKEMQFSQKKDAVVVSISLEPDFDTITEDSTDCLVRDLRSSFITCCFPLCPSVNCDCFLVF